MGSLGEWPAMLEEKAKEKLPPDLWEGFQITRKLFREYWASLVGKDEDLSMIDLTSSEKSLVSNLNSIEKENLDQVGAFGKRCFFRLRK